MPVRISGPGFAGAGVLRNLSDSGGFIETALPIAEFALVRVQIAGGLRGRRPAEYQGLVVRLTSSGAGIEWCESIGLQPEGLVQPHSRPIAAEDMLTASFA